MQDTSKILTPFGWKFIEELKVGDQVMNPDGNSCHVVAIHEKGMQPAYRVTFADGASVECDGDHLWGYWLARRKKKTAKREGRETPVVEDWNQNYFSRAMVRSTEYLKKIVDKGNENVVIPLCAPLRLQATLKWKQFPAYTLGVLLGDGNLGKSCNHKKPTWSKPDREIADFVREETGCEVTVYQRNEDDCPVWTVHLTDELATQLSATKLLPSYSDTKFIPPYYLRAKLEVRWAILQGLLDTDGYADERGHIEYCSVSEQLAKDVQYLARSLGFYATLTYKPENFYRNEDGKKIQCKPCWLVYLKGNDTDQAFKLSRKGDRCKKYNGGASWASRRMVSIEKIEDSYSRCIQVSSPNALYITNDFIVTHNSDLLLGLALTAHTDSIIYRREYPQLQALVQRSQDILRNTEASYNISQKIWKNIPGDRILEFGAVQFEKDKEKFQGRPHDALFFDEITGFTRSQFEFLTGWNRPSSRAPRDQRCRIVCTGNPPVTPEGRWVVEYWAPWLDSEHELYPYPPGELIWFVSVGGEDIVVATGNERPNDYVLKLDDGTEEVIEPHSRTFIPSTLADNPDLAGTNYRANLQALPEPLRSQLLFGDFGIGVQDDPWQVFPSDWIEAAFERHRKISNGFNFQQTHMGVDVARGGSDSTILAIRRGTYIDPLIIFPGSATPDGPKVAAQILKHYKSGVVNIDASGVGGSPFDSLNGVIPIFAIGGGEISVETTRNGNLGFFNKRSELMWKLREALDPDYGSNLALPPDNKLKAELCAYKWEVRPPSKRMMSVKGIPGKLLMKGQVKITDKEKISEMMGRSPDRADALIMSIAEAPQRKRSSGQSSASW